MKVDRALLLLQFARFLLRDPDRWARKTRMLARDAEHAPCEPTSPRARAFTVVGALERALHEYGWRSSETNLPARAYVAEAAAILAPAVRWQFRDQAIDQRAESLSHDALVAWLDAAIASRSGRPIDGRSCLACGAPSRELFCGATCAMAKAGAA